MNELLYFLSLALECSEVDSGALDVAIWQHDYYLIPLSKLIAHYGDVPHTLSAADWDAVDWWADAVIPDAVEIEQILPPTTSWSTSLDMWGANNENLFQVIYDEERQRVKGITIRFDLRTEYQPLSELVRKFIELSVKYEWVFLSAETSLILPPSYKVIAMDMKLSQAQSFVTDPYPEFIEKYKHIWEGRDQKN